VDWIYLAHVRDKWRALVNMIMNLRFPYNAGNFVTSWRTVSFSRKTLLLGVSSGILKRDGSARPEETALLLYITANVVEIIISENGTNWRIEFFRLLGVLRGVR
jgi:hypothetical protein